MKVLMFGPGVGHNIVRFLEYFNEHTEHELVYYYYNKPDQFSLTQYNNVKFVGTKNLPQLIAELRKSPDLLWVHNWTPWPILALIQKFKKKKSILNFNVWSERIPKSLKEDSRKAKFYNQFLHKCDVLQCTWFSTLNLLIEQGFTNTAMLRWGMVEEKFADLTDYSPNQFTQNFVSQLTSDNYKFFFPKSVSGGNRHDLIIDACVALKEKGIENYKVYFWLGNFNLEEKIADYRKKIEGNGLTNNIEFVHHEFVNHKDVQYIWRQMDCGLQILDADQLSTSFQEPQLYQKEIIASNIPSYQLFQQHFEVKLDLILNNSGELAKRMEGLITGKYSTNEVEKAKRRNVLLEHYRFNSNMVKILDFFTDFQRS